MQNQQFDLQAGESLRLGDHRITLLEIEDGTAIFEIEGPDGSVDRRPVRLSSAEVTNEEAILVA